MSIHEDIQAVEDEIKKTSYNKATSHHIGKLKAKLARLREEVIKKSSSKSGGEGFSVKKSGDASVALVGFPSVGKSTLLNKITDAHSEVGAYEFTTLDVIPGVLEYKNATIQILDVPGLVKGAASGRGRGREVIAVVRNCDLVIFIMDVFQNYHHQVLTQELNDAGIRINQSPPDVTIKRQDRGGVVIRSTVKQDLDDDLIKAILGEYKIHNAHILLRKNIDVDQLIDAVMGNRVYIPSVEIINKVDMADEYILAKCKEGFPNATYISADKGQNLEAVKEAIYNALDFIRVFLKPQGQTADLEEPMIVRNGTTVGDICDKLHRDFRRKFRYSQVWGDSAKHPGQRAGLEHVLKDADVLTLIIAM
jgi:small GTP-binding protein